MAEQSGCIVWPRGKPRKRRELAPLTARGVSGRSAGPRGDQYILVGCVGIRARRDRSLLGVAMEGAERQSLDVWRQVAGASYETRTATPGVADVMKTWLNGDASERPTQDAGAETAHELEVEIEQTRSRLAANEAERKELEAALRDLVSRRSAAVAHYSSPAVADAPRVIAASPAAEKVALFRRLFAGRADVFSVRWENRKTAKSGYAPACANEWVKGICDIIEKHLRGEGERGSGGDFVAGVYPLLPDEACWFLAADFDEETWAADALSVLETCQAKGVPAALERSRSGNGGHVWIFFSEPVSARTARQLGAAMLTETMERRPEIGFASHDSFFPSQDTMPVGGFGNLIALPLQRRARELGNSVFVDQDLRPHDDQWAFLAARPRLSAKGAAESAEHPIVDRTVVKLRKAKASDIGIVSADGAGLIKCEVASPSIDRLAVILPRVVRAASLQGFELAADCGSARFKSETEDIGFSITETVKREKHVLTVAERAKDGLGGTRSYRGFYHAPRYGRPAPRPH